MTEKGPRPQTGAPGPLLVFTTSPRPCCLSSTQTFMEWHTRTRASSPGEEWRFWQKPQAHKLTTATGTQFALLQNRELIMLKEKKRTSFVVRWLRIHLPTQGTWLRSLIWEFPTCCGATPQQERPRQWEAPLLKKEYHHSLQLSKGHVQKQRCSTAVNK